MAFWKLGRLLLRTILHGLLGPEAKLPDLEGSRLGFFQVEHGGSGSMQRGPLPTKLYLLIEASLAVCSAQSGLSWGEAFRGALGMAVWRFRKAKSPNTN